MRIAFDAKRAYHNDTGLGNYSRVLLNSLFRYYPQHLYWLATPGLSPLYHAPAATNIHTITPTGLSWFMKSLWRSSLVKRDLVKTHIELYHGLSHEIPRGIQNTSVKSVVTIHDLIFERYPDQYSAADVRIYRSKFQYACKHADRVIAISQQTKKDLIDIYEVPKQKISICYQSCNESFMSCAGADDKARIRKLYNMPEQFFLYVGSVIERKNLLLICKAIRALKGKLSIPLVVIGKGGAYMQQVKDYLKQNGKEHRVIFLSEHSQIDSAHMPAIYQSALALIYPSIFEGFGIPILEAMYSHVPVITSNVSCMPETGGDAAYYINPDSFEDLAVAMHKLAKDGEMRTGMIERGAVQAAKFSQHAAASQVMDVYESVMKTK